MELGKPKHPSIREQGPKIQDHTTMNAQVLSNPLAQLCCNEQNVIAKVGNHATLQWDKF